MYILGSERQRVSGEYDVRSWRVEVIEVVDYGVGWRAGGFGVVEKIIDGEIMWIVNLNFNIRVFRWLFEDGDQLCRFSYDIYENWKYE